MFYDQKPRPNSHEPGVVPLPRFRFSMLLRTVYALQAENCCSGTWRRKEFYHTLGRFHKLQIISTRTADGGQELEYPWAIPEQISSKNGDEIFGKLFYTDETCAVRGRSFSGRTKLLKPGSIFPPSEGRRTCLLNLERKATGSP